MKNCFVCCVLILAVSLSAQAANLFWRADIPPIVDDDWSTASNWYIDNATESAAAPTSMDAAYLLSADGITSPTVTLPGMQANLCQVGTWGFATTMNIEASGSLTTSTHMALSWDHNGASTVNINGGNLSVGTALYVGSVDTVTPAELTLNDGSVNAAVMVVNGFGYSGGMVDVYDGTMTLGDLVIGNPNAGDTSLSLYGGTVTVNGGIGLAGVAEVYPHFDFSGGILLVAGDYTETGNGAIPSWMAGGYIVSGTGDPIVYDFDVTNPGYTTITTIPEPATLVILALGGIVFRRQK